MRTPENKPSQAILSIVGGGKTYEVDTPALSDFLSRIEKRCNIHSIEDLRSQLSCVEDAVLDGIPPDWAAQEVQEPVRLIKELDYMFNAFLHPSKEVRL